jgi:hypothetical protein
VLWEAFAVRPSSRAQLLKASGFIAKQKGRSVANGAKNGPAPSQAFIFSSIYFNDIAFLLKAGRVPISALSSAVT